MSKNQFPTCAQHVIRVETKLIDENAKIPYRKRKTDAGYDIYAIENVIIPPKSIRNIRTGIILVVPPGYYYTIEGRSGLRRKKIFPGRAIIDATYTGEVTVDLENASDEDFTVECGHRIAQIIAHQQIDMTFDVMDDFTPYYSQRGTDGFGSSGM